MTTEIQTMSDLDYKKALAEIDRTQAETRKLMQESAKFQSEAIKMASENLKLKASFFLLPFTAGAAFIGATAALIKLLTQ